LLYLVDIERPNLLACVEEPIIDANPRKDDEIELVEVAI
jgi:hypothetical protein